MRGGRTEGVVNRAGVLLRRIASVRVIGHNVGIVWVEASLHPSLDPHSGSLKASPQLGLSHHPSRMRKTLSRYHVRLYRRIETHVEDSVLRSRGVRRGALLLMNT